MKKTIFILFVLFSLVSQAQKRQAINAYGYDWLRGSFQYAIAIPNDTFAIEADHRNRPHLAVKNDSLYRWSTSQLKWVNSGGAGGSSGSVTNVATSYGLLGGPITATGTLRADTSNLSTIANRDKLKDSLLTIINTKGNGTVTSVGSGYGITGGVITGSGTLRADTTGLSTKANVQHVIDSFVAAGQEIDTTLYSTKANVTKAKDSVVALLATKLNISDTLNKWVTNATLSGAGDSLVVYKNGTRYAYKLAGGGSSGLDSINITQPNDTTLVFNQLHSGSSIRTDTIVVRSTSASFYKNALRDSIILQIGNLRMAVKDSVGSGGGTTYWTAAGNDIYNNNSGNVIVGNGAASSVAKFYVKGGGTTSATSAAVIHNNAGNPIVQFRDDGLSYFGGSSISGYRMSVDSNALFGTIGTGAGYGSTSPLKVNYGGSYGTNTAGNAGNLKWVMYDGGAAAGQYGIGMSSNTMEFQTGTSGLFKFYPAHQATPAIVVGPNGITAGVDATPGYAVDLGNPFANTKLALFNNGSAALGFGIQSGQFRLHLNASSAKFSFMDAPAGNEIFTIKGTSQVGINNSSPDNLAALDITSTTRAFFPPRMTQTQRDAAGFGAISTATITGGTGYTTGTYSSVSLTGGTGTAAVATITVNGSGVVSSVVLTNTGRNYAVGDVLSASGLGAGSGFAYTITATLGVSGTIYCTNCTATDASTGVMQTWNGSTWKNHW